MPDNKMLELGALWKKESQKGEKYLTGLINLKSVGGPDKEVNLIIFSNKQKQKETHPDLRIYFSEPRNGGAAKTNAASAPKTAKTKAAPAAAAAPAPADDSGLL